MEKYISSFAKLSSHVFDKVYESQARQDLINTFQNGDLIDMILIITFIVAYGVAIQIAISGIFRKHRHFI